MKWRNNLHGLIFHWLAISVYCTVHLYFWCNSEMRNSIFSSRVCFMYALIASRLSSVDWNWLRGDRPSLMTSHYLYALMNVFQFLSHLQFDVYHLLTTNVNESQRFLWFEAPKCWQKKFFGDRKQNCSSCAITSLTQRNYNVRRQLK